MTKTKHGLKRGTLVHVKRGDYMGRVRAWHRISGDPAKASGYGTAEEYVPVFELPGQRGTDDHWDRNGGTMLVPKSDLRVVGNAK